MCSVEDNTRAMEADLEAISVSMVELQEELREIGGHPDCKLEDLSWEELEDEYDASATWAGGWCLLS